MKKLLALVFAVVLVLTGCGSNSETVHYVGKTEADQYGQYFTVEYDKKGDDITNTVFDYQFNDDGKLDALTSKVQYSKDGKYGMKEKNPSAAGEWHEEVQALNDYVNENDFFPSTTKQGEGEETKEVPNGVASATIGVDGFKEAFNAAKEA